MPPEQRVQNALQVIVQMSGFDGGHHKQYCIDQITRALCGGAKINAYEYEQTDEYREFVKEWEEGEDGPKTYEWDEGIAP